jgi:hypothetical protein
MARRRNGSDRGLARRLKRGATPQNARKAGVRFAKGHVKRAGRKKGTPNKLTREVKDAIVGAAEELGSDGKGKGGLQGYMKFLVREEPKTFGMLIRAVIPTQINATVRPPRVYRSADEIKAEMTARGIPYQRFFPPQFDHDDDVSEPANDGPVIDLEAEK